MNIEETIQFLEEKIAADDLAADAGVLLQLIEESRHGDDSAVVEIGEADMMFVLNWANLTLSHKGRTAGIKGKVCYSPGFPLR